jgi:hypothetical protein
VELLKACTALLMRRTREAHAIKGRTFVTVFDPGHRPNGASIGSIMPIEDYVHDALHLLELDRVQGIGHLDMGVALALDRDG